MIFSVSSTLSLRKSRKLKRLVLETYLDTKIRSYVCEQMARLRAKSKETWNFNTAAEPHFQGYNFSEENLTDFYNDPQNPFAKIIKKSLGRIQRKSQEEFLGKMTSLEYFGKGKNSFKKTTTISKLNSRQSIRLIPQQTFKSIAASPSTSKNNNNSPASLGDEITKEKKLLNKMGTFHAGNEKFKISFEEGFFLNLIVSTIEFVVSQPEANLEHLRKF